MEEIKEEKKVEKEIVKKPKKRIFLKLIILLIFFFGGAAGMYALIYFYPAEFTTMTTKTIKDVTVTDKGIAEAVEKVYDAVVVVQTYKNKKVYSSGTGFVYKIDDKKAFILTNNHVIDGGDAVSVVFTNGKEITAEIIGNDKYSDIAVLSLDAFEDMQVVEIGKSDDMKVGDTVFAVGAPLDSEYSWTVTRGILSGKDRMVEVNSSKNTTADWIMKVLQTDTAINSGNSGGPLANSNGEVIGITSLKLVSSGVEGMGFAIPIETALEYADKFVKKEDIERPYLGVSMYSLSDINDAFYDSEVVSKGVYVTDVEKGSPAYEGGLRKGDIISKINDDEVNNVAYLKYNLYKYSAGDKIKMTIFRGPDKKTIEITLGKNSD